MKTLLTVCGMILALSLSGCAKDPQEVIDGIMKDYGLLLTSLDMKASCEEATKTVLNLTDSGTENVRRLLNDFNGLSRDNKKKVIEALTKQGGDLNKQYWVPFKERCPTHTPQVGRIIGGYLRRFGVE